MKAFNYLLLGCFSIMIGIFLFLIAQTLYESMWIIRSLYNSGPPVSAFSDPVVLLGIVILLSTVLIASGIVVAKKVAKIRKDESSEVTYLGIPFSVISVYCVLSAIHFVCVKGYGSYVSCRIAGASSIHEKQFLLAREVIIYLASRDCIIGITFLLIGAFSWWMAMKIFKGDIGTITPSEESGVK